MLKVLDRLPQSVRGRVCWLCICDCGETTTVVGSKLKSGHTKSCGCKRKVDLSGVKYGKLNPIGPLDYYIKGSVAWEFLCDCGRKHIAAANSVNCGDIKSCGCTKEPGENHFRWAGGVRRYEKTSIICPDCGLTRDVLVKNIKKHNHTGRCRCCSMRHESSKVKGEYHYKWKGGITPENEAIRKSSGYLDWRLQVKNRDGYCCQACYKKGGDIHAHHIVSFGVSSELRMELSNGITLCKHCHLIFHSRYGYMNNEDQIQEFIYGTKRQAERNIVQAA